MDSFHAHLETVSVSVVALKFGQITSVVLIVLHIFLRQLVYIIFITLHKLNICEDTSYDSEGRYCSCVNKQE